jgi:hypothetical protein
MLFSFKLLNIKCKTVLSGEDSDWGAEDGIRVFFLVFTGSGFRQLLISGREYPPPDVVESYSFYPGEELDLQFFPPINAPDWETDPADVGETDAVMIAVVGLNEGLPWIGGGGGFGSGSKAAIAGFEELSQKLSEEAAKQFERNMFTGGQVGAAAAGAVWVAVVFKLLEEMVEELNKASDCRGVAFAFELGMSMKFLFQQHLQNKRSTRTLSAASAAGPVHFAALSKVAADCGNPEYEVQLEITRHQLLDLAVEDKKSLPKYGPPRRFEPAFPPCAPKDRDIYVRPIHYERTITVRPTVPKYGTLHPTWKIEDTELPDNGSDFLTLAKEVRVPVTSSKEVRNVRVDYEVITIGADHLLRLTTRGQDANYTLKVSLSYKFDDNGPWVLFRETDLFVVGQAVAGDDAYHEYVSCLEGYRKIMTKYVRAHQVIGPGSPVEEVIRFESDMLAVTRMLTRDAQGPDARGSERTPRLESE